MDITPLPQLLDHWSAVLAYSSGPLTPQETNNLRDVLRRSRAEIERLEGELATFARASVDLSNQLVMCKRERDALTDRMITAGLMS